MKSYVQVGFQVVDFKASDDMAGRSAKWRGLQAIQRPPDSLT